VAISASEGDIQTKIKEGILKEMSIGYRTINSTETIVNEQTIYNLTEIKLYEISLVTIAANELATIEGMKSEEKKTYFDDAFERLIVTERGEKKRFELMKLKAQIIALIDREPETNKEHTPDTEPPQIFDIDSKKLINLLF